MPFSESHPILFTLIILTIVSGAVSAIHAICGSLDDTPEWEDRYCDNWDCECHMEMEDEEEDKD